MICKVNIMKCLRGTVMSKKWTEEEVLRIMTLIRNLDVDSLNRLVGEEDGQVELGTFVLDSNPGPQELAEKADRNRILNEIVATLNPRERQVITLRYGLKDGKFRTLDEVGAMYGVSRERIRQIESKALNRLKWLILCKYKLKKGDL